MTTPSSQRRSAALRNASDGKLLASVTPAFLLRVTREDFLNRFDDRLDGGDGGGELEQLRVVVGAGFHDPINDLGRQFGVLRDDVAVCAVAALRTGEAVFDAHRASVLQLARVRLPHGLVFLVTAGDRAASRGERQTVGKFLHQPARLPGRPVPAGARKHCRNCRRWKRPAQTCTRPGRGSARGRKPFSSRRRTSRVRTPFASGGSHPSAARRKAGTEKESCGQRIPRRAAPGSNGTPARMTRLFARFLNLGCASPRMNASASAAAFLPLATDSTTVDVPSTMSPA